jgi:hypothetical protein
MPARAMRMMLHPMTRKPGPRRAFSCVRRSTRAGVRTLPVDRPSNSVTGRRASVRSVETEVSDGLYLVVTGLVLRRLLHRDVDYRTDVHVRVPVRAAGANSETGASRIVGRVLTREDWRADASRSLSARSKTLHRNNAAIAKGIVSALSWRDWRRSANTSPVEAGLFFLDVV